MEKPNLSFQERLAESRRAVMKVINTKRSAARKPENKRGDLVKTDKPDSPSPYLLQLEANRIKREKEKELAKQEREAKQRTIAARKKEAADLLAKKRAKEKRVARETLRIFKDLQTQRDKATGRDKPYKTIPFTKQGKIEVRIDKNTVIYVREGQDIEAAISRIVNRAATKEKDRL